MMVIRTPHMMVMCARRSARVDPWQTLHAWARATQRRGSTATICRERGRATLTFGLMEAGRAASCAAPPMRHWPPPQLPWLQCAHLVHLIVDALAQLIAVNRLVRRVEYVRVERRERPPQPEGREVAAHERVLHRAAVGRVEREHHRQQLRCLLARRRGRGRGDASVAWSHRNRGGLGGAERKRRGGGGEQGASGGATKCASD
mmetsp:Transcript_26581/g.70915  ORF Transcript_26581/g.70915 Transcript_26581/m.70915 type:complete len:203 (+) Transcript_26581:451-1059(+)